MNIQPTNIEWFCSFIEISFGVYECTKCGIRVASEDGAPAMLCSLPSAVVEPKAEIVPFAKKVQNFIISATEHINNGAKLCTDDQIAERYNICQACEHFINSSCNKCGCPIMRNRRFISKLSWASSECPIGKWGKASN